MNIHNYSLPSSLTALSIANTHVRTSKRQVINKQYQNQLFRVLNPAQRVIVRILVLDAILAKPSVQCKVSRTTPSLILVLRGQAAKP